MRGRGGARPTSGRHVGGATHGSASLTGVGEFALRTATHLADLADVELVRRLVEVEPSIEGRGQALNELGKRVRYRVGLGRKRCLHLGFVTDATRKQRRPAST